MNNYRLMVTGSFEAGHFLPDYDGPCKNQHGHCWKVRAIWEAEDVCPQSGIALDLTSLKKSLRRILGQYDHQNLNDFFAQPTAEHLAEKIYTLLAQDQNIGEQLLYVLVEETEGCFVAYSPRGFENDEHLLN